MGVIYRNGDATLPDPGRKTIIAHVVNNVGAWGKGFVVALGKRYPWARTMYKKEWRLFKLGEVMWVGDLEDGVCVANMFAQKDVRGPKPRVRYGKLRRCLENVFAHAFAFGAVVHMPRVGCGLGGGKWEEVKEIIESVADRMRADVVVFGGKE